VKGHFNTLKVNITCGRESVSCLITTGRSRGDLDPKLLAKNAERKLKGRKTIISVVRGIGSRELRRDGVAIVY